MKAWFLLRLGSRRVPFVAAAIAFLIALPSVSTGYFIDDSYHEYILRGLALPGGSRGVWDLYRFADGSAAFVEGVRSGWYPWWTNLELRLAFFRPLPSLWRWADHSLFGMSAFVPHLETCVVYAALVFVAARVYGKWIGGAAAGLSSLAFAVDDGHCIPVTWIANRYALLAALFALSALLLHTRARAATAPSLALRIASPLLLALALCSGEMSLGALGYLAAWAWFVDPKGRRSAFVALSPHALVAGIWAVAYRAMGYGASGSAFYLDPLGSPAVFAKNMWVRLPELVVSGVLGPPSEAWTFVPAAKAPWVALGALLVGGLVVVTVIRLALRNERAPRGMVASLACGALVSVVPVCATVPDDRNFLMAGFGFFGVLGLAIEGVWAAVPSPSRSSRAFVAALVALHFVLAPLLFPLRGLTMALSFGGFIRRGAATIPSGEGTQNKTLVILGVPDSMIVVYMMLDRLLEPGPHVARATILSVQSSGQYTMRCIDTDTIELENPVGELHSPFVGLYTNKAFFAGQVFDRELDRVEVLAVTDAGEPSALRIHLKLPADSRIWLVWRDKGLVAIEPPRPGETSTFDGVDLFDAMKQ